MNLVQKIDPGILQWIVAQARAGHSREEVMEAMQRSGWDRAVARRAIEKTLEGNADEPMTAASILPWPDLTSAPSELRIGDRCVKVLAELRLPRLLLLGDLLSSQECEALIELATPRLERSQTVDNWDGGSSASEARTSQGMFMQRGENEVVRAIEARIAELLNWPVDRGEGMQVLRYAPGEKFRPHHDYFAPSLPGHSRILEQGGQRLATLLMYLNTPEEGGQTEFPDAGLDVTPSRGNAILFAYDRPSPATRSLHGGRPVLRGEKWIATKWLRAEMFS